MKILGIETSCDETAVGVVEAETGRVLADEIYSQLTEHAPYGGVVPELASRAHLERLPGKVKVALEKAGIELKDVDGVAATVGPGLTTALAIGSTFAKTLAVAAEKPFYGTNHLEGHALSPLLVLGREGVFPYVLLLVSGGHCQLVAVRGVGHYELLGTTLDDAVGECFDKVGKVLGLGHPAGPAVEKLAATGDASAVKLPMPKGDGSLDFSFSGLKTAVRDAVAKGIYKPEDVAASFQAVVVKVMRKKVELALDAEPEAKALVVAGGVAANAAIRAALEEVCGTRKVKFAAPPLRMCTDNAVMIAWAAGLRALDGLPSVGLEARVRPRWPLMEVADA